MGAALDSHVAAASSEHCVASLLDGLHVVATAGVSSGFRCSSSRLSTAFWSLLQAEQSAGHGSDVANASIVPERADASLVGCPGGRGSAVAAAALGARQRRPRSAQSTAFLFGLGGLQMPGGSGPRFGIMGKENPQDMCVDIHEPLHFGSMEHGWFIGDKNMVLWEDSPKCARDGGKVRVHYANGVANVKGIDNFDDRPNDAMVHMYHAKTFRTISQDNLSKLAAAVRSHQCVENPENLAGSGGGFSFFGGPPPRDENDKMSFEVANVTVGGTCEDTDEPPPTLL